MDRSPVAWEACPAVGDAYWAAGRSTEALAAYRHCVELEPSNLDHVLELGLAHERLGDLEPAATLFTEGAELDAEYFDFQIATGRLLIRRGQPLEAEQMLRDVLSLAPEHADAVFALGLALERQGRVREAGQAYEDGLAMAPDYSAMAVGLARMKLLAGDAETARRLAAAEVLTHPDDVDALLVLAMALEQLDRLDEASQAHS